MTIGLMLALFAGFLCLGVPVAHGMGLAAVLALIYEGQVPILLLAQRVYDALDNFSLLAVPLFIEGFTELTSSLAEGHGEPRIGGRPCPSILLLVRFAAGPR